VSLEDYKLKDNARRFELYERSRALTLGLGKAVDYALNIGIDRIWRRIQELSGLLRQKLSSIGSITLHDIGNDKCGIVTFSVDRLDPTLIKNKLAEKNINVSVGLAKSTLYYMSKHNLTAVVRASIHYYNTEEEIGIFCDALIALCEDAKFSVA
jgi:selenocysteine lyase/cysteine desulfurase